MRTNLSNKFRDYMQELPNEPTTFKEALKKVQELEEKIEQDDAQFSRDLGARKRMGWLKLKGKGDKEPSEKATEADTVDIKPNGDKLTISNELLLPADSVVVPLQPELPSEVAPIIDQELNDNKKDKSVAEGEPEPRISPRQPRRRKHKPNLSRTKAAREKSRGEQDTVREAPVDLESKLEIESPLAEPKAHVRRHRRRHDKDHGRGSRPLSEQKD